MTPLDPGGDAPSGAGAEGGANGIESRLSRLETHIQYLATREGLQRLKVWVLLGVIGGMAVAAGVGAGIARWLPMPLP